MSRYPRQRSGNDLAQPFSRSVGPRNLKTAHAYFRTLVAYAVHGLLDGPTLFRQCRCCALWRVVGVIEVHRDRLAVAYSHVLDSLWPRSANALVVLHPVGALERLGVARAALGPHQWQPELVGLLSSPHVVLAPWKLLTGDHYTRISRLVYPILGLAPKT